MKIIEIINSLSSGGAERFVIDLSNELAEQGHDVMLVMMEEPNGINDFYCNDLNPKVRFETLDLTIPFSIRSGEKAILKFKPLYRDFKADVVHMHMGGVMPTINNILLHRKTKFFYTIHSLPQRYAKTRITKLLNKILYSSNLVTPITISEECQKSYVDFYKLSAPPMIPNGRSKLTKTSDFDNVVKEVNSYRMTANTKIFVSVGRCHPVKNQKLMIEAFNKLANDGYDVQLIIIGYGYDESELGKQLKEMAGDNIHFLGQKRNVSDYVCASDYFTLSSLVEGLPITLLEALSVGVTPVCTPAGGIPNVIIDGETGYLSKDFDIDSYIESIIAALQQPIDANKLINYWDTSFSMKDCARKYIRLFESKGLQSL